MKNSQGHRRLTMWFTAMVALLVASLAAGSAAADERTKPSAPTKKGASADPPVGMGMGLLYVSSVLAMPALMFFVEQRLHPGAPLSPVAPILGTGALMTGVAGGIVIFAPRITVSPAGSLPRSPGAPQVTPSLGVAIRFP